MKFNFFKSSKKKVTKNHEGEVAYKMSPKMELYTAVVTGSLSKFTYEGEKERLNRIIALIKKVDPIFVAKLAIYTREKMYLRSLPLVLLVELSKIHRGDNLVSKTVERVIQRADEITELLAYYQMANARTDVKKLNRLSKQIQKGVALAFNKFDEYQFAKYNRKTAVSLKDALFLTHPKAANEGQQVLFNKIVKDELAVPYTWEVELSTLGQEGFSNDEAKAKAVAEKWEELIESNRLGYMALLRNLRNILQAGVSTAIIQVVAQRLADPAQVRRSKQLPFRFLSAYRELKDTKLEFSAYLMTALEKAVLTSAENIKGFDLDTRVLLAADVSGSMYQPISKRSKIRCYDIGLTLSMLLRNRSENVVTGIFGNKWREVNLPQANILANTMTLNSMEGSVGYATNGYKVISALIAQRRVMSKVMFFTDLQMWDSTGGANSLQNTWKQYKRDVAPHAKLYLFDLAGYGNTPLSVKREDVYLIAGWSEKVFDVLAALENGKSSMSAIKKIEI